MYNLSYRHESNYQINNVPPQVSNSLEMEEDQDSLPNTTKQRIVQTIVDFLAIIIVFVCFALVYTLQPAKIRYFSCDESDIFYPYKKDTIPFWAVGIFGILGPLIVILGVEILNGHFFWFQRSKRNRFRRFFVCLFHALSLFILGISIVLLLTEIGKRWVGRLRPHFMDVCKPDYSKISCTSPGLTGTYYNKISTGGSFCTGDPAEIKEARYSFPSGHASFSWYTMLFTIIYLEARFIVIRLRYIKTLIQMSCFIAAFVTMLSRVSDYHHRGTDVIGGTILGAIVAIGITMFVGRVLWVYEKKRDYFDFDLKNRTQSHSM